MTAQMVVIEGLIGTFTDVLDPNGIDPRRANAAASTARAIVDVMEFGMYEERLNRIEELLGQVADKRRHV